jgi:hypothetical protein
VLEVYLWVGEGAFCAVVLRRGWWDLWEAWCLVSFSGCFEVVSAIVMLMC